MLLAIRVRSKILNAEVNTKKVVRLDRRHIVKLDGRHEPLAVFTTDQFGIEFDVAKLRRLVLSHLNRNVMAVVGGFDIDRRQTLVPECAFAVGDRRQWTKRHLRSCHACS